MSASAGTTPSTPEYLVLSGGVVEVADVEGEYGLRLGHCLLR
jgi:hypothetical protein